MPSDVLAASAELSTCRLSVALWFAGFDHLSGYIDVMDTAFSAWAKRHHCVRAIGCSAGYYGDRLGCQHECEWDRAPWVVRTHHMPLLPCRKLYTIADKVDCLYGKTLRGLIGQDGSALRLEAFW